MKKITYIFFIALGTGGFFTSCDNYLEDKIASPNDPTEVSPDLLLSNTEVATFATFGGQLARQTQIFTQQIAGTSAGSQTVQFMNYNITELTNENEWEVIYNGVLMNAKLIVDNSGSANPHYAGMAKVLTALNLGLATDLWGDVPYSQALTGLDGEFEASYDTQQSLLDDSNGGSIFALLDAAIADLSRPASDNVQIPAGDDFIYGGDVSKWIAAAHSLKARYYNRLSQRDAAGSAASALASMASGITSSADDFNMIFGPNGAEQNQWYAFNQQRGDYIKMGEFFVDLLNTNADPRLPFYAAQDPQGNYSGTPKDDVDSIQTSNVGSYLNSLAATALPLVSFVEMKFIEAEAQLRAGAPLAAATAYNEAVIESVTQVTGAAPSAAFIAAFAAETPATITLETIMTQKYIAMFGQCEAYSDFRRTGFPALTPNPIGNITTIPVRLVTPQNERLYNPKATIVGDLTTPVYWDN